MRGQLGINSRGDTIIEVLLAIAIVSSVLAGAFTTTTRALNGTRLAQERAEALKIAEAQAEAVRTAAYRSDINIFNTSQPLFCLPANDFTDRKSFGATSLPNLTSDSFTAYPAECRNFGTRYNISVQYEEANDDSFAIRARWDGPTGSRQEVVLRFRIHENIATALAPPVGGPGPSVPDPIPPASQCQVLTNPVVVPEVFTTDPDLSISHLFYRPNRNARLTYDYNNVAGPLSALADGCRFDVFITTRDPDHPDGDQPNERLYARFFFADNTFVDTGLTNDLPVSQKTIESLVGRIAFPSPPVRVQFRHFSLHPDGNNDSPNSIDPASIRFVYAGD